jgi:rRNA maturation endonuclease Nob1
MLAELFIVSTVTIDEESGSETPEISVTQAPGARCERCWKWYETMSTQEPELCQRCGDAVSAAA